MVSTMPCLRHWILTCFSRSTPDLGPCRLCPFQSDPLQHPLACGALLWPGGSAVSSGPTCLLPLFCSGATLAPAAGLGAGIQTDQGQEPGKEGRHGDSVSPAGLQEGTQHVCTVSCLQEAEGGAWWGGNLLVL